MSMLMERFLGREGEERFQIREDFGNEQVWLRRDRKVEAKEKSSQMIETGGL